MCEYSIVLPYGSVAVTSFDIITRAIVVVTFFARCIISSESEIASMLLLGRLCGVSIQFIKLV